MTEAERKDALVEFAEREKFCPFTVEELIRWAILTTLEYFHGNRTHTAKHLGLSIRAVRNHIAKYREQGFFIPDSDYAREHRPTHRCAECRRRFDSEVAA